MRIRVYVTVGCPSVCPSVYLCVVIRQQQRGAAGLLLNARRVDRRYRSRAAGAGAQQQGRRSRDRSTALSSKRRVDEGDIFETCTCVYDMNVCPVSKFELIEGGVFKPAPLWKLQWPAILGAMGLGFSLTHDPSDP